MSENQKQKQLEEDLSAALRTCDRLYVLLEKERAQKAMFWKLLVRIGKNIVSGYFANGSTEHASTTFELGRMSVAMQEEESFAFYADAIRNIGERNPQLFKEPTQKDFFEDLRQAIQKESEVEFNRQEDEKTLKTRTESPVPVQDASQ